jgi:hypothetical protein
MKIKKKPINVLKPIGDSVDIVSGGSSTLLNTMPYAHTMNIVSGDATYLLAEFSGPSEINYSSGLNILFHKKFRTLLGHIITKRIFLGNIVRGNIFGISYTFIQISF